MTKIDIISGFLGAGKTTWIKKLISEVFIGEKLVLIENEFGEIGIDGGFLKESGIEISEMNSGCICCSLVGDFDRNLREVLERFSPDRILIEPSGVGKLSDVIVSVRKLEASQTVQLSRAITVVNALKARKQMRAFGEFFNNQIEHASLIVLSRTQKVECEQIEILLKDIREKNAQANIVTTPWEELRGEVILELFARENALAEELLQAEIARHGEEHSHDHREKHSHEHEENHGHKHEHGEEHHHEHGEEHSHDHGEDCDCGCHDHHDHHSHNHHAEEIFGSWGIETADVFSPEQIEQALRAFCETKSYGEILRAKGMVAGTEDKWIYFDMVDGEYELRDGTPDYTGRICVIGVELQEEKIRELFHS
ncbi:hypothetical protein FACS1894111_07120 [Clostridia bacterium]|nr:hypothetical protein FACS1894111_07120 [Clostridia bacterium]